MLIRCGLAAIAAAFVVLMINSPVHSACNSIPSIENVNTNPAMPGGQPPPGIGGVNQPGGPNLRAFKYKLAVGRIDRVDVVPGVTHSFRLQPDQTCVSQPDVRFPESARKALENPQDIAVFIAFPLDGGKRVAVRAHVPTTMCAALGEALKEKVEADPRTKDVAPSFQLMPSCSNQDLKVVTDDAGAASLEVPVPAPAEMDALAKTTGALSPLILATRIGSKTPVELATLVRSVGQQGCEGGCAQLADAGAFACGSNIYALTLSTGGKLAYEVDPIPCAVSMPTSFGANDFKKQCENDAGNPSTLPSCDALPHTLSFWEDQCGGIHIPFSWVGIRGGSGTTGVDRKVAGRSGTGRKKTIDMSRIWVPGREFVGSTPIGDPQGTGPTTNWRRPEIDVWYPSDGPEEFGLIGIVDQDDSIVHVFPRLRASVYCNNATGSPEACMGVNMGRGEVGLGCACRDRYAADCECLPQQGVPQYFACAGGPYAGMPCTRDAHCNLGGTCTQKPSCQAAGAVWEPNVVSTTSKQCWVDDDCKTETNAPQCGYMLFNFDSRKNPNTGIVDLDAKVTGSGAKARGACDVSPFAACSDGGSNGGPPACTSGTCRGFLLKAGASVP